MEIIRGIVGLVIFVAIAFAFSSNKKAVDWRLVGTGITLQILFGLLVTKVEAVENAFNWISQGFVTFLGFSRNGAEFIFGSLVTDMDSFGFIFAFQVLPTIIFFAAVSSGLYYLGVLQKIVYVIAFVMSKTMRLSGAESLSAAGNIFLGQTEAPLLVKPFIERMTKSEIMCLMTGGMATMAGGVLAGYVTFLGGSDPAEQAKFAAYLLSASIMNAPAAIVMSKILLPEAEPEKIDTELKVNNEKLGANLIDAIANGTSDGLSLALNVGAMLLSFIAIIYAINGALGALGEIRDINEAIASSSGGQFDGLSLQYILGQIFRVFAALMGIDWSESLIVGSLLGQKTVINEFIAYSNLAELKANNLLSVKAIVVSTYALCGFSNFSSIAIQIGGIGGLAPSRQSDLSKLGLKALLGATIACMMTGTIAGMIVG
ncbi:nucleoside transporter C-terminal domain-containing protein [Limibacter armeniacum]|uniref:NupC/NupG family nucleoside CNT transporter n=1 Tax=Limibacter armeniacum TaxID=466084 RepID=UPI002FE625EB